MSINKNLIVIKPETGVLEGKSLKLSPTNVDDTAEKNESLIIIESKNAPPNSLVLSKDETLELYQLLTHHLRTLFVAGDEEVNGLVSLWMQQGDDGKLYTLDIKG